MDNNDSYYSTDDSHTVHHFAIVTRKTVSSTEDRGQTDRVTALRVGH